MDQSPDLIAGDKLQLEYWDSTAKEDAHLENHFLHIPSSAHFM